MRRLSGPALALSVLLAACQPADAATVKVIDGSRLIAIESSAATPLTLFNEAGVSIQPGDGALVNGSLLPLDQPVQQNDFTQLQVRRGAPITVDSPSGQQIIQSPAFTIGDALTQAGYQLFAQDVLIPPADTLIDGPMSVTYTPSRELAVFADGNILRVRSAANSVGEALAGAGIPLIGLDYSSPSENEALPSDGNIRVVRVEERVSVTLESIPYDTQIVSSPDLAVGQQQTIDAGLVGLAMVRTRVRREDGKVVSREIETKTVIRSAVTRVIADGTKIVLQQVPASGVPGEYWLAVQMYATVYSPCQSGTGGCSYSTASGAPAGHGVVAVDYSIYSYLAGMRVYIPGYGLATIGDTGGGPIIESQLGVPRTRWIDLGFDEGHIVDMTGWVTVYFLAPAPAEIPYFLK